MVKKGKGRGKIQTKQHFVSTEQAINTVSELLSEFWGIHSQSGFGNLNLEDPTSPAHRLLTAVNGLIQEQKQVGLASKPSKAACTSAFDQWLKTNGVDTNEFPVKVKTDLPEGCGLVATRNINSGDVLLSMPRELILSTLTAEESGISTIQAEPIQVFILI